MFDFNLGSEETSGLEPCQRPGTVALEFIQKGQRRSGRSSTTPEILSPSTRFEEPVRTIQMLKQLKAFPLR